MYVIYEKKSQYYPLFVMVLGCFFSGRFVPLDVLSLGRFVSEDVLSHWTFCPKDVLSIVRFVSGCFVLGRFVSGLFVPEDVLSQDVLSMYHDNPPRD
jgi:hypothetical protein